MGGLGGEECEDSGAGGAGVSLVLNGRNVVRSTCTRRVRQWGGPNGGLDFLGLWDVDWGLGTVGLGFDMDHNTNAH